MLKMVTEIDACATKVAGMAECDENGPDFAPGVCFREMITCFNDGLQHFAQCLDTNDPVLDNVATPKGDGLLVCFYNMAIQIEACWAKVHFKRS